MTRQGHYADYSEISMNIKLVAGVTILGTLLGCSSRPPTNGESQARWEAEQQRKSISDLQTKVATQSSRINELERNLAETQRTAEKSTLTVAKLEEMLAKDLRAYTIGKLQARLALEEEKLVRLKVDFERATNAMYHRRVGVKQGMVLSTSDREREIADLQGEIARELKTQAKQVEEMKRELELADQT